jgi:hypothetical protein
VTLPKPSSTSASASTSAPIEGYTQTGAGTNKDTDKDKDPDTGTETDTDALADRERDVHTVFTFALTPFESISALSLEGKKCFAAAVSQAQAVRALVDSIVLSIAQVRIW